MARILNEKTGTVTIGVLDKDVKLVEHLIEVTFEDELGIPHTVFAHKDGPFKTAEEIVQAWHDHTLHAKPEEQSAPETPPPPAGPVIE